MRRVIAQESLPALRRRSASARHVFGDGRLADLDAQLQQFSMDPRRTPERVLTAHLPDQVAHVIRNRRPPGPPSRSPAPVQAEATAMPAHQRLGLEDHRGLDHGWEPTVQPDEDQPVATLQSNPSRDGSLQNEQLVPEKEELGFTCRSRPAQRQEQRPKELQNVNHPRKRLYDRSPTASPDQIFSNDRYFPSCTSEARKLGDTRIASARVARTLPRARGGAHEISREKKGARPARRSSQHRLQGGRISSAGKRR